MMQKYYTANDVSLIIDKTAETIQLNIGQTSVTMPIGDWSKLISNPQTAKILLLHDKEV